MTIFEALNWAGEKLKHLGESKGDAKHNPKLDAQVLLAFVISKGTAYLFSHAHDPLQPAQIEQFQRLVERRSRHEPVAYLTGTKAFYNKDFFVNPSVLIPRPATETLVEMALTLITAQTLIVDIGTGSGAIAVSIASNTQRPVVAIDLDTQAIAVATENARRHNVDKRIMFLTGNLLEPLIDESRGESMGQHLLITANLPYLTARQYEALDEDVRTYEPATALVSGVDGLDHYDALLRQMLRFRHLLPDDIDLLLEIDPAQKDTAPALVRSVFPHAAQRVHADLTGKPRMLHARLTVARV